MKDGTWQETDGLSVYTTNYSLEGLQPSTLYQARILVTQSGLIGIIRRYMLTLIM